MSRDIVAEIHEGLLRAGPTRLKFTRTAFHMIPKLHRPRILDVGCGEGGPTVELAKLSNGEVIGLDIHQPSLDRLAIRIEEARLSDRVHVVKGSMLKMDFPDESFDIIWSEGSIHIIGFERGLDEWRRFIKPKGFLVVHEGTWPRPEPPQELCEHWQGRYRGIGTASEYIDAISSRGYKLVGHFTLPENVWWVEYFSPLKERIRALREKYMEDCEALAVLDREEREVDMFKKYPGWYGSAFFVMQKVPRGASA
jgi:ubiquinone/menaquinone biosynthesis C-methylase UbiE